MIAQTYWTVVNEYPNMDMFGYLMNSQSHLAKKKRVLTRNNDNQIFFLSLTVIKLYLTEESKLFKMDNQQPWGAAVRQLINIRNFHDPFEIYQNNTFVHIIDLKFIVLLCYFLIIE